MILKTENIHKYYRVGENKLHILKGIFLEIKAGEFLAIRGPSGAGKSTLLHILGGLEKPDEGKVYFKAEDIYSFTDSKLSEIRNKNLGFVFQFYHLIPELNLLENVSLPLLIQGWGRKTAYKKAEEILSYFNLQERKSHFPNQLSGGEQQRTAIARAIITEPLVLFADEPTGNLDSQMGQEMLKLLQRINLERKTTIILVTHDQEVASWAKREIYIKDGRVTNKEGEDEGLP